MRAPPGSARVRGLTRCTGGKESPEVVSRPGRHIRSWGNPQASRGGGQALENARGESPIYRGLYFNPARADDLEILRWLLAMPRSHRSRAIKAVLLAGLPAYVAAHYPDQPPPAANEVPSRLAAASRSTPPPTPADPHSPCRPMSPLPQFPSLQS